MRSGILPTIASLVLALSIAADSGEANYLPAVGGSAANQEATNTSFISPEELKAKIAKNEPVTIIDVRSANSLESDGKIKGAFYVKLRRLKYRLGFQPLKDVPRDRDVVTYCACPNDEASVRAAQILRESGFKRVHVLKGGWVVWKKTKGQTEPMLRGT